MGSIKNKIPRGVKHSIWNVLDASLYPVIYMALAPVLMKSMGASAFGLWVVLNSIMTTLQLLNFNMSITATKNVAAELSVNNSRGASDVINGILQITAGLFLLAVLIGAVLAIGAKEYNWWHLSQMGIRGIFSSILLAASVAGLRYFDQILQSILKAAEQFRLAALLNILNRILLLGILLYMAVSGKSIVSMLLANVIFSLVYLTIQFFYIKKVMPFFKVGWAQDKAVYRNLLHFSIWPWLQSLFVVITFQTDRFWVSSVAGLSEVSGYGLTATMFNHIHVIFIAMVAWLLPRISSMTTKGEDPSSLYDVVRGGLFGFIVISLLGFYFISPVLFRFWAGDEIYSQMAPYIKAFIAFELVFAHTIMPFFYLNASGEEKTATRVTALYCFTCYTFMICGLLVCKTPVAMIHGMTLAMCLTMPAINVAVQKKMLGKPVTETAILEMTPMYLGIGLIYNSNVWIGIGLAVLLLVLLWKFYLSNVYQNRNLWKQAPHT